MAQPFSVTAPGGAIADDGTSLFVLDLEGRPEICNLELQIANLSHDAVSDLDFYLISPFGESIEIMTDRGGAVAVVGVDLVFSDNASAPPSQTGPLVSGTYLPEGLANGTDNGFSTYDGTSGGSDDWILLVVDDSTGGSGSFESFTIRGENGPGYCSPPTGACCAREIGTCTEGVTEAECPDPDVNWVEGAPCDPDPFPIACGAYACCKPDDTCENLTEAECLAVEPLYKPRLWQGGELCGVADQQCPLNACLDRTGSCLEGHDRICDGGERPGKLCFNDTNCRARCIGNVCDTGSHAGEACSFDTDCNDDGVCDATDPNNPTCVGGARHGSPCNPERGNRDCLEAFCRRFPGCDSPNCCTFACEHAPGFPLFTEFCCQVEWDEVCAELARDVCRGACCFEDPTEFICTDGTTFNDCSEAAGSFFVDERCDDVAVGGSCPAVGACCDERSGICTDELTEGECNQSAPVATWYPARLCDELDPPCSARAGACCDRAAVGGTCTDDVLDSDCVGDYLTFFVGELCTDVEARGDCVERSGACCDRSAVGGSCESGVPRSECDTTDPQVAWIEDEDCAEDGGTVHCPEHTGACCDGNTGTCTSDVPESQCPTSDPQFTWFKDTSCEELDPPCEQHRGACCDRIAGTCTDDVLPDDCTNLLPGDQFIWHKSQRCSAVDCTEATGACCDSNAGPLADAGLCAEGVAFADCQCPTCTWSKGETCPAVTCDADFVAIPAVTEWGLLITTLLLLTAAKLYFGRFPATSRR